MKRLLTYKGFKKLIITIALFVNSIYAQQYLPIAVETNTWSVSYQKYFINGDTILGGAIFKKVYMKEMDSTFNLTGTLYTCALKDSSDGRTYFWARSEPAPNVLYDWNLNVGDSIKLFTNFISNYGSLANYTNNYYKDVVIGTDSVFIYDQYRKRITVSAYNIGGWPFHWIEGIGCLQGPFANSFANMPTDVSPLTLLCFHQNDTLKYHNYYFGGDTLNQDDACYHYHTLGLSETDPEFIVVYPNPVSDILAIQSDFQNVNGYTILGIDGKIIMEGLQSPINVSSLPTGIYFVANSKRTWHRKFVKI